MVVDGENGWFGAKRDTDIVVGKPKAGGSDVGMHRSYEIMVLDGHMTNKIPH